MGDNLGKMNKLVALSLALVALVAFATAAPVASRRAIFFEEQRAGKVEYTNWPPVACKADGDCVGLNASYCMNDKTKTAPFFCHTPLLTLTSGLARRLASVSTLTSRRFSSQKMISNLVTPNGLCLSSTTMAPTRLCSTPSPVTSTSHQENKRIV